MIAILIKRIIFFSDSLKIRQLLAELYGIDDKICYENLNQICRFNLIKLLSNKWYVIDDESGGHINLIKTGYKYCYRIPLIGFIHSLEYFPLTQSVEIFSDGIGIKDNKLIALHKSNFRAEEKKLDRFEAKANELLMAPFMLNNNEQISVSFNNLFKNYVERVYIISSNLTNFIITSNTKCIDIMHFLHINAIESIFNIPNATKSLWSN